MREIESWRASWVDPRLERAETLQAWRKDIVDPSLGSGGDPSPESLKGIGRRITKVENFQTLVLTIGAMVGAGIGFFGGALRKLMGIPS